MAITPDAILSIIATEAGREAGSLRADATLAELDIGSIDVASVLFELEDRFGVEIDPDKVAPSLTIAQFVAHVQGLARE